MNTNFNLIKRKFLTDFFLSNKDKIPKLVLSNFQDNKSNNANNNYTINSSWLDILKASKTINCLVAPTPFDFHDTGFKTDDELGQLLIDISIKKKSLELLDQLDDFDEEDFYQILYDYVIENRYHKRSFYNIIRKIRTITLDMLPNIF